eukprot:Sdes_comp20958_c0_seq1m18701
MPHDYLPSTTLLPASWSKKPQETLSQSSQCSLSSLDDVYKGLLETPNSQGDRESSLCLNVNTNEDIPSFHHISPQEVANFPFVEHSSAPNPPPPQFLSHNLSLPTRPCEDIQLVWVLHQDHQLYWPAVVIPASNQQSDIADHNVLVWYFGSHTYKWLPSELVFPFQMDEARISQLRSLMGLFSTVAETALQELCNFIIVGALPCELHDISSFVLDPSQYMNSQVDISSGSSHLYDTPPLDLPSLDSSLNSIPSQFNYDRRFRCSVAQCSHEFESAGSLQKHLKTHERKRYVCVVDGCQKTFYYRSHLSRHELVHSGEKPFQCHFEDCNKGFSDVPSLNRHKLIHTGEKPHTCPVQQCEKSFTLHHHLQYHIRTHTLEKPFKCAWEMCDKRFSRKDNMMSHMRIHTGEKPFKCNFDNCAEKFTRSSDCLKHKKTHLGFKPFECIVSDCEKSFARLSDLKRHRLNVHGK